MFFFGGNQRPGREDYRPAVHDSDGLSIREATNDWIWRPLVNPKRLLVTSFALSDPAGFGLMQRARSFEQLPGPGGALRLAALGVDRAEGRRGDPGRVELVQIPVPDETNDNVVAYWVPDGQPKPGEPFAYGYRVLWQKDREMRPPIGWVRETRRGRGYSKADDGSIELHVDFEGAMLNRMPSERDRGRRAVDRRQR